MSLLLAFVLACQMQAIDRAKVGLRHGHPYAAIDALLDAQDLGVDKAIVWPLMWRAIRDIEGAQASTGIAEARQ